MATWRNITKYRKSISLLLIAVFLLLKVFPAHIHFHAETDSPTHYSGHTVDFHSANDLIHLDDEHHNDVVEIKVATDNLLKYSKINAISFYLFSLVLAVLTVVLLHSHQYLIRSTLPLYTPYHHFTPLLRAPPKHYSLFTL